MTLATRRRPAVSSTEVTARTDRVPAAFLEEGEMTDLGESVGIALFPFVGLEVDKSEDRVKTDTLPEADNVKRC